MGKKASDDSSENYVIKISLKFVVVSLVSSFILAFGVGRAARLALIGNNNVGGSAEMNLETGAKPRGLPAATLQDGKTMPKTIYTSKNFDTSTTTASSLLIEKPRNQTGTPTGPTSEDWKVCDAADIGESCSRSKGAPVEDLVVDEVAVDEEEHLPAGQHLLVDMKNLNSAFLDDEERLAQAMVDVVNDSKLTLLSYHCHKMTPSGVSCAGVLLESHVSFHTWPEEGVITLDLFTCGSGALLPVIPIITRLFGIPSDDPDAEPPMAVWAHKLRGFRDYLGDRTKRPNALESQDLGRLILGTMDLDVKDEIASVQTNFQKIDIYDILNARSMDAHGYLASQESGDNYYTQNKELFIPDRQVYLDGVLQSTRIGDEPYHESLIQPGMFTHPNPKRVAIIGGGEGASLREVLKHKSLEKVHMIEIDEIMVEVSRKYIPSWNTCSDIQGSVDSCFEDPRTEMFYEDALGFFIDRYHDPEDAEKYEKYDFIIMDALDPQDNVEFADALYNNVVFLDSLYSALSEDGIIAMQLGEAPHFSSPSEELSIDKNRVIILDLMEKAGFKSFHVYEEGHSKFMGPWTQVVACKDASCRNNWYKSVPEVDIAIKERIIPTVSGKPGLKYFDGATMNTYQVPHKTFQTLHCRKTPVPASCSSIESFVTPTSGSTISVPSKSLGIIKNDKTTPVGAYFDAFGAGASHKVQGGGSMSVGGSKSHDVKPKEYLYDPVYDRNLEKFFGMMQTSDEL